MPHRHLVLNRTEFYPTSDIISRNFHFPAPTFALKNRIRWYNRSRKSRMIRSAVEPQDPLF